MVFLEMGQIAEVPELDAAAADDVLLIPVDLISPFTMIQVPSRTSQGCEHDTATKLAGVRVIFSRTSELEF